MTTTRRRSILTDSENPNPDSHDPATQSHDPSLCAVQGCPLFGTRSNSLLGTNRWYCAVHDGLVAIPASEATNRIHGMRERMLRAYGTRNRSGLLTDTDPKAFAIMVRYCRGEQQSDGEQATLASMIPPPQRVDTWANAAGLVGTVDR